MSFLRLARYDALLYLTNRVVARIPSHTLRLWYYRCCWKCEIGPNSFIFMDAWFDTRGSFRMGRNSTINQKCRLDNRGSITIGDNVAISTETCILTADHDPRDDDFGGRARSVQIEDYVFIGTRAMILPGVTLGRGAVVAAGAVVTRSVAPYAIVAGIPAREIGRRQTDLNYNASYCRLFT
jgi:acetyltransferase-like isoleucine patch superfamily enzyme